MRGLTCMWIREATKSGGNDRIKKKYNIALRDRDGTKQSGVPSLCRRGFKFPNMTHIVFNQADLEKMGKPRRAKPGLKGTLFATS